MIRFLLHSFRVTSLQQLSLANIWQSIYNFIDKQQQTKLVTNINNKAIPSEFCPCLVPQIGKNNCKMLNYTNKLNQQKSTPIWRANNNCNASLLTKDINARGVEQSGNTQAHANNNNSNENVQNFAHKFATELQHTTVPNQCQYAFQLSSILGNPSKSSELYRDRHVNRHGALLYNNDTTHSNNNIVIQNHSNPIHNKILYPLLKNSKDQNLPTRSNSQNNKHNYNSHGEQRDHRRAESEKRRTCQLQEYSETPKQSRCPHFTEAVSAAQHKQSRSPYKPTHFNQYQTQHTLSASQHTHYTSQHTPHPDKLPSCSQHPTIGDASQRCGQNTDSHADHTEFYKMIIKQEVEKYMKKDNKFYEECFQHIMIQNSCLTKQVLMREMQLRRLKQQLNKAKQKHINFYRNHSPNEDENKSGNKNGDSISIMDINRYGNMDVIYSAASEEEESIINEQRVILKLIDRGPKRQTLQRDKREGRVRGEGQKEEQDWKRLNQSMRESENAQQNSKPEQSEYGKNESNSINRRNESGDSRQELSSVNYSYSEDQSPYLHSAIRYYATPPCQPPVLLLSDHYEPGQKQTHNHDETDHLSMKEINKLIEEIENQENKMRLRQTNSFWVDKYEIQSINHQDGQLIQTSRAVSIQKQILGSQMSFEFDTQKQINLKNQQAPQVGVEPVKIEDQYKDKHKKIQYQKLVSEDGIKLGNKNKGNEVKKQLVNMTQLTHNLQGLDCTRLDRLRMKKGLVSRKNTAPIPNSDHSGPKNTNIFQDN